jgi:hypothetical protein
MHFLIAENRHCLDEAGKIIDRIINTASYPPSLTNTLKYLS